MKKTLLLILFGLLVATNCFAGSPAVEEQNIVKFTTEYQSTDATYDITSIHWVSSSGDEISGAGGFILRDSNDVDIASCEATSVSDQCHFVFGEPLRVEGLNPVHLDGDLYIYGKRR